MSQENFKSYKSIQNSYNAKFVLAFINKYGKDVRMFITEKLDGANIQFLFSPDGSIKVGKRSSWITPEEKFFDIWNTIPKYEHELNFFKELAKEKNVNVRVYGELFGKGINDRVDYGNEQYIKIFDVWIGDVHLSPSEVQAQLVLWGISDFSAPIICSEYITLLESLDLKPGLSLCGKNNSEGFVVRPYLENFYMNEDAFLIKVKAKEFAEVEQQKHKVKSLDKYDVNLMNLQTKFLDYVNENRLLSVISKEGEIQDPKEIGKYIKLIYEDAVKDFEQDNDISKLNEKDRKFVLNMGSKPALLVKNRLANMGSKHE